MPWSLILSIVNEGLKLVSEERRTRFKDKWNSLLNASDAAENATFPNFNDVDVAKLKQRRENFLLAYHSELQEEVAEKKKA